MLKNGLFGPSGNDTRLPRKRRSMKKQKASGKLSLAGLRDSQSPRLEFTFCPGQLSTILAAVLLILIFCYTATQSIYYFTGHGSQFGLAHLFNLDQENNIPTWFSSFLLSLCSMLLALIGCHKKRLQQPYAIHWLGLAAIFLCLSIDETASIHELTVGPLRKALHVEQPGYFWEAWVVLYGLFALAIGLSYVKLLVALPPKIRWLITLAAGFYVGGAIGVEMMRATTAPYDPATLTYIIGGLCEESMEMAGLLIFFYALSLYLQSEVGEIRIVFVDDKPTTVDGKFTKLAYPLKRQIAK
jgi:hypothetical protein